MITIPEKIIKLNPEKLDYSDVEETKKILYMLMNCIENACSEIRRLEEEMDMPRSIGEAMSLLAERTTQARNKNK